LNDERPLFAFAGLWRPWRGVRAKEEGDHLLFAFLTTEPNDLIRPIHAKAMPVMLTEDQIGTWLEAPEAEALALALPFPSNAMTIVASGPREDSGALHGNAPSGPLFDGV
jgi:putative SOS response-associated peptidase YedK